MSRFKKTVSRNYYPLHISAEMHALREGIHIDDFFWKVDSFLVARHNSKLCACFEDPFPPIPVTNFEDLFSNLSHLTDIFSGVAQDLEKNLRLMPGATREDALNLYSAFKFNMARMLMGSRIAFRMKNLLSTTFTLTDQEYASLFHPYKKTLVPREIEAIKKTQKSLAKGGDAQAEAEKLSIEYGWIHSEYRGKAWESDDYLSELKRPSVFFEPGEVAILHLPEDIQAIGGLLAYLHDEGKSAVVRASWALRETLKALGEDETLIMASTEEEFFAWAHTGTRPSDEIKTRVDGDIGVLLEQNTVTYFFGTEKVLKLISDLGLGSFFEQASLEGDVIKGTSAFRGKVQGKVRVIFDQKDSESLVEGEVLVASMTTPELIAGMRKAAAFVTDEGGITCHAAIVARELHIPCIVGTKVATQVLRDGDSVEVDADKGIVRILT